MRRPSCLDRPAVLYHRDAIWNLRNLRLFETMSRRQLRTLRPLFRVQHYRRNEFLFHMGDTADVLFFVEKGAIKVSTFSHDGEEHILDIFKPGDTFGELFVNARHRRTAAAQAMTAVTVRTLTDEAFKRLMQFSPDVCRYFVRYLIDEHRRTLVRTEALAHMDSGPRLVAFLLDLAERCGERAGDYLSVMPNKVTQEELARMVGLNRTTVTLSINRYRRSGVLGGGRSVLLINAARARALLQKAGLALVST